MNNNVTNENIQPVAQWEAPVLYTEDWLNTFGGAGTAPTETTAFHT